MDGSNITTDRNEIERWAEEHDAVPVREGGRIELVPEDTMTADQERIDWETFHREVDETEQVVMLHGESSGRNRFEVSDRSTALERVDLEEEYDRDQIEQRLLEGETITGTVTETTVVTETIVEEATLESEIVDREIVDRQVTNLELLDRNCRSCSVEGEVGDIEYGEWYDTDRFLHDDADVVTGEQERYEEYPYDVSVEIDENWSVTIDERERYVVETRITDVDVSETDTVDSRDLESHVDIDAVHDQLLRSIDLGASDETEVVETGTVDTETYDIESEFTENDRISTTLTSRRTIEKEISEQWRLMTEVVSGELLSRETSQESVRETALAEREGEYETTTAAGTGETTEEMRVMPQDDDVGKPVVVSTGDQIGMVSEVEGNVAYVDPHPGITEKIMAKLGWGGRDEEDFPLDADRIAAITDDEVRLTGDYDDAELKNIEQPD